jgi:hypothetical protein
MRTFRSAPRRPLALALLLAAANSHAASVLVEGELQEFGLPAEGRYDLRLQPFADADSTRALSPATEVLGVEVHNGRFRVDLELPDGLNGDPAIAVAVRANGETAGYAPLPVRVQAKVGPIGVCWSTTGDEGAIPGTHFLGTTDLQPFELRVGNTTGLRVLPVGINTTDTPNVVGGYGGNVIGAGVVGATIAGGGGNVSGIDSPNRIQGEYGSIGGGLDNTLAGPRSVIGGGNNNTVSAEAATIAGGTSNQVSSIGGAVLGGESNRAGGNRSVVGGGFNNGANGTVAFVGGGRDNVAGGDASTILGGELNTASAMRSVVLGGFRNCAGAPGSLAAGQRAKVRPGTESAAAGFGCSGVSVAGVDGDSGTFVWADSQESDFVSTGSDQFLVRARGGLALNGNVLPSGIDVFLRSGANNNPFDLMLGASGAPTAVLLQSVAGALSIAGANISNPQAPSYTNYAQWNGSGQFRLFVDNPVKPTSGGFAAASDARLKTDIRPLDGALESLLKLEGVRFRYRDGTPTGFYAPGEQTGFIAQQVEQVFPDWVIDDPSGYKLVGSKGFDALTVEALRELRAEKDAEIADLREENVLLAARLARIEETLLRAAHP